MSMIGKTLAHYAVTSLLGKGGMGEVYQAKDQKLGRDVAIKVLPEEFAQDTDRVARFQREAKLLASLNHPNIASIHGLEESDDTHFLVLELIEGDTLADQIKRGPIPVEEALKLALQIAEALEAAHEKGVIHRDLKPANIKVTPEGKVKVLDFGLAKAFSGEQSDLNLSNSPTLSDMATQQGVILGTAAYMSPEQARGKPVDRRADIWAFGVVLFEMLTGRTTFPGNDVTDILAAVIRSEPEWNSLPVNLHGRLREVLERCLVKEAKNRYSGISDAKFDISKVLTDPSGVITQPITIVERQPGIRTILPWVAAIVMVGIIIGAAVWILKPAPPPEPKQVISLEHNLPEDQQIVMPPLLFGHTLAVSPDGNQFIYSTSGGLYIRSVGELKAQIIPGTDKDNPQSPFFSPDGQSVGYWSQADNKLKRIDIRGGASQPLCDVTWVFGAIWYEDNMIVYADVTSGIMSVSANGGNPVTLVKGFSAAPQLLPDGKSVMFTDTSSQPYTIVVQTLESEERTELFPGDIARYLPTGHLVYTFEENLYAVQFNPDTLEVTSGQVPIEEGVGLHAISDSGTLAYLPRMIAPQSERTLVWVDRDGNEEPINAPPHLYRYPDISPDGTKVALVAEIEGNLDIYIWDLVREDMSRLTRNEASVMLIM